MNVFGEIYSGWWPEMDIEASEMMLLCLLRILTFLSARVFFGAA